MNKKEQNKPNIEELKGLLDTPKDIPIEKLPPPKGISQEIIDAVKNPNADNKLYGYKDLAEEVQRMPEVPRITTGLSELDELLDGGLQPGEVMVLSATTKQGKCFQKGTKILMYDGSIRKVEDIQVGDKIMGNDSTPRNILSLGRGSEMMYKINNRDGSFYTVNESHILSLQRTRDHKWRYDNIKLEKRPNKNRDGEINNISVRDYLNSSNNFKHLYKGYKNGVEFKYKKTLIPPYFLGIWLGDGTATNTGITTADKPIVDYLYNLAKLLNLKVTIRHQENNKSDIYCLVREKKYLPVNKRNKNGYGKIESLMAKLRKYDLINNKHIPFDFKVNSMESRLELLAGLIDSDGYYNRPNSVVFVNKNKELCEDVVFLGRSLGFYVSLKKFRNKKYNRDYFKVYIGGKIENIPALLKRKIKITTEKRKNVLRQAIDVEKIGKGDYYGFEIDGNKLFLLENFTVVHNTSFAQTMSYLQGLEGISNLWFTLEMSWQELTRKFMAMDTQLQGGGKISQLPIYYPIDNRGLSLEWMEKQIIKAKNTQDVKIVYIDHLHFLVPLAESKSNISFLVGGIIREIKQLSVRLEIPILLIAHTRKTDINTMPDINSPRDSSFIAQESDFTAILWREPIKQKKSRDVMDNSEIFSDKTVFSLVANRRNGKTKKIALGMWGGRFYPYLEYMARRSEAHMQDRNEDLEKVKDKVMSTEEKEVDKKAKQLFDFGS